MLSDSGASFRLHASPRQPSMKPRLRWREYLAICAFIVTLATTGITSVKADVDAEEGHIGDGISAKKKVVLESLFRFPASQLGKEFKPLIGGLDEWIGKGSKEGTSTDGGANSRIDGFGAAHAQIYTSTPYIKRYHNACYYPPNKSFYNRLEGKRKEIEHTFLPVDEEFESLNQLFSEMEDLADEIPSSLSSNSPFSKDASVFSSDERWTWRPAAHFSSRGTKERHAFRNYMHNFVTSFMRSLPNTKPPEREDAWEMEGRNSGTFWYPPGGVREWHTNRLDIKGNPMLENQPWRMYYIRILPSTTTPPGDSDKSDGNAKERTGSGMHLLYEGEDRGVTLDELQTAGARPVVDNVNDSNSNDLNTNNGTASITSAVWRVPDEDGYVTVFRLPELWHCIVSDTVHRYSLGFAFSEAQIQNLLNKAQIPFHFKETTQSENMAASVADKTTTDEL
jgi:hypothetical protein